MPLHLPQNLSRNSFLATCTLGLVLAASLVACGGGGGGSSTASSSGAPSIASSTGTITAFGSVFVNGHEFSTSRARFIDDDNESSSTSASGLEVGMVVDVVPTSGSTASSPEAGELHLHPLARGYVDAVDTTASTVQVMGQQVQVTSSTNFSDHRACALATTPTCTPVSGIAGLTASSATPPGTYVTVHGYLYSGSSGSTNMVATLISAADLPATPGKHAFKVEGPLLVNGTASSIGSLVLDFTSTVCRVTGTVTPCASAFTAGQVIAAGSSIAPTTPTNFAPAVARLASKVPVQTAGQTIELEGVVSSVNSTASSFVVRGITVDASALGTSLPAVGDLVEVEGTVASSGQSLTATRLKTIHAAANVSVGLQGDVDTSSIAGTGPAYTLVLLGQTVNINAQTRLADMSTRNWDHDDPAAKPFNISTFADYLKASASKHLIVRTEADASGKLTALSLAIVPASTVAAVTGVVDANPVVVNSTTTGTPTTFSIHGVAVSADPAAIYKPHTAAMQSIAAGDLVTVFGTYNASLLSVGATTTRSNYAMDIGVPVINLRDRANF